MRFVIITGMSGAGKSQAIKCMEDLGYFCVDNLIPSLIPKFAEVCFQSRGKIEKVAIVVDIRGGELFNEFLPVLEELKEIGYPYEILYLEASNDILINRYKELRRAHPLARNEGKLLASIEEERKILGAVKNVATHILDTSRTTIKSFRDEMANLYAEDGGASKGLLINIISFGFKYGIPIECDLVFDVRFIHNPFYVEKLKGLTGRDRPVIKFVLDNDLTKTFFARLTDMLDFLIPNYIIEGKTQLVIGIGCTGGKHRSVAIADKLRMNLADKNKSVFVEHRDIFKDKKPE